MKLFPLLLLLLLTAPASRAATYYFSATEGDDTRTPQQAQNPATPWKSVDRHNTFVRFFEAGDSILFKRGEVFYGGLVVRTRGSIGKTTYYGAYGTGVNPVLTGFTAVKGWTLHSNGIYWAPLEARNLQMVTINGEARGMGRYPNSGYLKYEGNNGNTSITDNELPASPNWTGAEIAVRKFRFILDRHAVTSHSGTTLQYSTSTLNGNNSSFSPVKNNGYFIQNHLNTLDQFGEWYHDTLNKRLYVFFGSNAPDNYTVKASTRDFNGFVTTAYFLKFENLDFEGGNTRGLSLINVSNTEVVNCRFYNQGGTSLYGIDLNAVVARNITINTSFSNGLLFENNANNCLIDGVTVLQTNMIAGTGRSGSGTGIGIKAVGEGNTISNNTVTGSGYNGIHFLGNNVLVERNYVDTFCTVLDDGGGIYTYTGPSNENQYNRVIRNNIVLNAIGAKAGTDAYSYEPFGKAAGIYLDEHANGVEIHDNTVANSDWAGLFLHYARNNVIRNNLFYNHRFQVFVSQFSPDTRNNTLTDNQYIARLPFQQTFYYHTSVSDSPAAMGRFNYNYYARPLDDNNTIRVDNYFTGGNGTTYLSLAQWKAAYKLDSLSQTSPLLFSSADDNIRFEYNTTSTAKTVSLGTNYLDIKNRPYSGNMTLPPFSSIVLLKATAVSRTAQTISFPAVGGKTDGDAPFAVNATASSGLPVALRVLSGPATVSGSTVTLTGPGTVSLEASQGGNGSFTAAVPVVQNITVSPNPANPPVGKTAQSISFGSMPFRTWGQPPFHLSATASSGLPVSYRVVSGPATVTNRTVTMIGVGTVTIEASQAGSERFTAAPPVTRSFTVGKSNQTLTFPSIPNKTFGDPPFALNAYASSGVAVNYRVVSGPATVTDSIVTLTGSGTVTIEAIQPGNELTNPTYPLQRSFTVAPAQGGTKTQQTISFEPIGAKTFGDGPFTATATASSGLPVSFRIVSGPGSVSGSTVTITGAGNIVIEASQSGNASYQPATPVTQNVTVNKAVQNISFPAIPNKTQGDPPFSLAATASSGLPVSYRVISGPATVSGNTVTLNGSGTVTIEAGQSGNENYHPAAAVTQSFVVASSTGGTGKQQQTISFGTLSYKTYTSPPFTLTATTTSGLPVSYRVVSGPVTISGNTVTITGVGNVTIEAQQTGNESFHAAAPVQRSFTVGKAGQSITFTAPPGKTYGDPPFALNATASSGLPVQYRIVSGPATISGNTVTLTGSGTVTVEASQPGNANFSAAYPLQRSFTVTPSSNTSGAAISGGRVDGQSPATEGRINELTIYPNPVQGEGFVKVNVAETSAGYLAIYDSKGMMAKQLGYRRFEGGRQAVIPLPVQGLAKGVYYLRFTSGKNLISQVFQVQ